MISVGLLAAILLLGGPLLLVIWLFLDGIRSTLARRTIRQSKGEMSAVVCSRREIGEDAVSLELRRPFRPLPRFLAGQHVVLSLPGHPPIRRAYSLSRWQRIPWTYELSIKRTDEGMASRHLIEVVRVGDRLRISRPRGSFVDPERTAPLVVIAAGIGVTPFRAMLHARMNEGVSAPFHLHMSARRASGLYFHDEFVALAKAHPWFGYFPRITGSDAEWRGEQGRITAGSILDLSPKDAMFLLCAGAPMENDLRSSLAASGVPAEKIRTERFGLSVNPVAVEGTLHVGANSFKFEEATTLLDVLERNGCTVAAECRAGECGCCQVEVVEGAVRNIVSGEREAGRVLACAVVPEGDLRVRLEK